MPASVGPDRHLPQVAPAACYSPHCSSPAGASLPRLQLDTTLLVLQQCHAPRLPTSAASLGRPRPALPCPVLPCLPALPARPCLPECERPSFLVAALVLECRLLAVGNEVTQPPYGLPRGWATSAHLQPTSPPPPAFENTTTHRPNACHLPAFAPVAPMSSVPCVRHIETSHMRGAGMQDEQRSQSLMPTACAIFSCPGI